MNASAFPSRRRHTRIAPSFRPEQTDFFFRVRFLRTRRSA
jgi:hypothetical protein